MIPALLGLWRFYIGRPQLHMAHEIGETLLRLAQRSHDPALSVVAHYALGATELFLGVLPAARQHLEAGISLYTPDQRWAPRFVRGKIQGLPVVSMQRQPCRCWDTPIKP